MRQECVSKGTPAQLASLVHRAFVALQADGRQVPILRSIDQQPLNDGSDGYILGPALDALTAHLQIDNRTGEPAERYAMLLFEQEPGDVSRLYLHIEPAGWTLFGRMFWDDLRGELARRRLLVDEPASAPESAPKKRGAPTLAEREPTTRQIEQMGEYRRLTAGGTSKPAAAQLVEVSDYRRLEAWLEAWPQWAE